MPHIDLLVTLTGGLAAALVLGYLTQRLGLSPIVGYLIGGIAIGPYTPGFVANHALAEQLAEVGVILLMFGVGLQFHLKELLAVRRIAIPGAVIQILVATSLGAVVTQAFGWSWSAGIVFGLALSVASTVVLMRILADHRDLHTPTGHIAVGWLVVEDLFTVLALVLLPVLFSEGPAEPGQVPLALGLAVFKMVALVAFTFLVGGRFIPWVLERVAATHSRELFTLAILVLALGIAVGSAEVFGVSMALGSFLAGMVVGRSDFSLRAASEALPMRDAFAVLFFVSVGMLLNPRYLLEAPGLVAATLGIVIIGKPLAALGLVLLLGYPLKIALAVAVALAQIGEFSFILATMGREIGLLSDAATNTLVAAALLSITLNPLFYRWVNALTTRRQLQSDAQTALASAPPESSHDRPLLALRHRTILVGYGPVGQTVTRLLRDNEIEPTVIELNRATIQHLQAEGIVAVYGDASHRETLLSAGIDKAGSLILSCSISLRTSAEIIRLARQLHPTIRVLARSAYVHEIAALHQVGAERVFTCEGEVALALTETILRALGATPEQMDRERDRVHKDLFERPTRVAHRTMQSEPSEAVRER